MGTAKKTKLTEETKRTKKKGYVDINLPNIQPRYSVNSMGSIYDTYDGVLVISEEYRNNIVANLINKRNKVVRKRVDEIVAATFIPKSDKDISLNRTIPYHIDGYKTNNRASNLRWATKLEATIMDSIRCINLTTSKELAPHICKLLEAGYTEEDLCYVIGKLLKEYRLIIRNIKNHRIFKDISSHYNW
jgi:hypothetical protein